MFSRPLLLLGLTLLASVDVQTVSSMSTRVSQALHNYVSENIKTDTTLAQKVMLHPQLTSLLQEHIDTVVVNAATAKAQHAHGVHVAVVSNMTHEAGMGQFYGEERATP